MSTRMLNPKEAATMTGLSESTLAKLRMTGEGPVYLQPRRKVLYPEDEVQRWLEASRKTSTRDQVA